MKNPGRQEKLRRQQKKARFFFLCLRPFVGIINYTAFIFNFSTRWCFLPNYSSEHAALWSFSTLYPVRASVGGKCPPFFPCFWKKKKKNARIRSRLIPILDYISFSSPCVRPPAFFAHSKNWCTAWKLSAGRRDRYALKGQKMSVGAKRTSEIFSSHLHFYWAVDVGVTWPRNFLLIYIIRASIILEFCIFSVKLSGGYVYV